MISFKVVIVGGEMSVDWPVCVCFCCCSVVVYPEMESFASLSYIEFLTFRALYAVYHICCLAVQVLC